MEPNQDGTEVLETPVDTGEGAVETPIEPELTAEQIVELKEKAAKADELEEKNKKLFERAKKAEAGKSKDLGDLSQKDLLFLAKSDIHDEDVETVLDWARFKKIPVTDAHKELKSVLSLRTEERRTADATHTAGGARGSSKVSGEDLLAAASRGEEVDLTDENAAEIFRARLARKLKNRKR